MIGIKQRELPFRPRQRQRNAGQSGATADIEHAAAAHMRQHRQRIEQMMREHFRRLAHGGQVVGLVPFFDQRQIIEHALLRRRPDIQSERCDARGQFTGEAHALFCKVSCACFRCTNSTEIAAGVTPEMREAWPMVSGFTRLSFCWTSIDRLRTCV